MRPASNEQCGIRDDSDPDRPHGCFRSRGHFGPHICGDQDCNYEWPRTPRLRLA